MTRALSLVDAAIASQARARAIEVERIKGEEPPRTCKLGCGRRLWKNSTTGICSECQRRHLGLAICRGCGAPLDTRYRVIYCVACRRGDAERRAA